MNTVYKYPINLHGGTSLQLPASAKFLSAGQDPQGKVSVWVLLDPQYPAITRNVRCVFTGEFFPEPMNYISTFLFNTLVVHVFEIFP